MNSKPVLFTSIWAASLGAAFFIGKSIQPENQENTQNSSSFSSASSSNKTINSSSGTQSNTSSARARLEAAPMVRKGSSVEQIVKDIAPSNDAIERNNALLALIDSLDPGDFASVVASFRELGITRQRQGEYEMLLTAWAKVDPSQALDYASENTGGAFAQNTILSTWAVTNPDAAIAWAEANHENKDEANPWLVGVIEGIAANDIPRATSLMETLPRSEERGRALRNLVSRLSATDPEEAKTWAGSVEDEGLRSAAYAYTAESLASNDPAEAAAWLAEIGNVDALNRVGEEIVGDWFRDSPEDAKNWVVNLPAEAMSEAAEGIVGNVVRDNPVEAAEWLSDLANSNPDTNFDSSIRELVSGSARQDPELAAVWVAGLSNTRDQTRAYFQVLSQWRNQDATAATAWINENQDSLPEFISNRFQQVQQR